MPTIRQKATWRMRADGKTDAEITETLRVAERDLGRLPVILGDNGQISPAGVLDDEESWHEDDVAAWAGAQARHDVEAIAEATPDLNLFLSTLDRPEFADGSQLKGALAADGVPAEAAAHAWEAYVAAARATARRLRGEG